MLLSSGFSNTKQNTILLENDFHTGTRVAESIANPKPVIKNFQIETLLSQYKSHSLNDLNNADLMHRVDTKYLLPVCNLEKLLTVLAPFYSVLEIERSRLFPYQTTYFDTPEFRFYLMHHNGKLDRFKIRHRLYVDSGDLYVEVKHKTNKKVTKKDRVLIDGDSSSRNRINELVSSPFKGSRTPLFKSLVCSYTRIAMADEKNGERLTLDFNLAFTNPNQMQIKQSNPVLIAEVKRENHKAPSKFMDLMGRYRHKPVSFSKYCIGCAQIHSERIKTNRFKETLRALEQISNRETGAAEFKSKLLN